MTSLDSSLMSEELSIELDDDLQSDNFEGTESHYDVEKENLQCKFRPIRISDVKIKVSSQLKIRDLTNDARILLEGHLDLKPVGSLQTWRSIAEFFGAENDVIMNIADSNRRTLTLLDRFAEKKAEDLIFALERSQRIDTLYSVRELLKDNNLFRTPSKLDVQLRHTQNTPSYSNASTVPQELHISSNRLNQVHSGEPEILIVHYETIKEEIRPYKWFMKNLNGAALRSTVKKKIVDCQSIISDVNVWDSIQEGFKRAESVVFCFNASLITLNAKNTEPNTSEKHIKNILMLAKTELGQNDFKNFRFRPVYFQQSNSTHSTVDWLSSTISYEFPSQFPVLAERLFQVKSPDK